MKKISSIILLIMLLTSIVSVFGEEVETENTQSFSELPVSFIDSLFGGNTFSFTARTASDVYESNEVRSWNSPYLYEQGVSTAGDNCQAGDLIVAYVSDSNGNWKMDIWDHSYLKTTSSDNIELNNPEYGAWVHDFMMDQTGLFSNKAYYGYICYIPDPELDRVYVGEKCVNPTTLCSNAYQVGGVGAYKCDISNQETCYSCDGSTCQKTAPVVLPKAQLYDIRANGEQSSTVVQGQNYEVTGTIVLEGTCDGCVVETGADYYGETFSVARSSTGACGDDSTVGAKFSGTNTNIKFELVDKVNQKPGKYKVPVFVFSECSGEILDQEEFTLVVEEKFEESEVTCYWCDGTSKRSGKYSDCKFAPEGATEDSNLQCNQEGYTCYWCEGNSIKSGSFDTRCQSPMSSTKPSSCGDEPNPTIQCSRCNPTTGDLEYGEFESCSDGWISGTAECESTEKTCYKCNDGSVASIVSQYQCPVGYSEQEPESCETNVECHWCYNYDVKTGYYEDSCPKGTSENIPDCSPDDPVSCYWCDSSNNLRNKDYEAVCPPGTSEERPVCGVEETCYWCEGEELEIQTYEVCPSGTQNTLISCSDIVEVDCDNNPNSEACNVQSCQEGSSSPFCEVVCCDVDGNTGWEYSGVCSRPLSESVCTDGPKDNTGVIAFIVVVATLLLIAIFVTLNNRKK